MKRFMSFAALAAVLLAACTQEAARPSSAGGGVQPGQTAPDFALPAADGGKVQLSDFEGKPVLLYFSMGPG